MILNNYIFEVLFDKNIDMYTEYISDVKKEYIEIIRFLSSCQEVATIRKWVHKLIGLIGYFEDMNYEMIYYCRLVLNIDKDVNNISLYSPYIDWIVHYDKKKLGL
jgi:hypothetical protein